MPWQTEVIRPASNSRKAIKDMKTGITTIEVVDDFGSVRDCHHGLVSGSIAREWWSIHPDDPLSAEARRTGQLKIAEVSGLFERKLTQK